VQTISRKEIIIFIILGVFTLAFLYWFFKPTGGGLCRSSRIGEFGIADYSCSRYQLWRQGNSFPIP